MWQADSPAISLSLHSSPSKRLGTTKSNRGRSHKNNQVPMFFVKIRSRKRRPKRVPPPKGKELTTSHAGISWPTATCLTPENPPLLAGKAHRRELGLLLQGRKGKTKGKKMAIRRKLDFASSTVHGIGCFITIFLTEASKSSLGKNCVSLLSLTIVHQCFGYNCKNKTLRLG